VDERDDAGEAQGDDPGQEVVEAEVVLHL
jgi:hypothetical protein